MTWKTDGDKKGLMEGNLIVGSKGVREAEACVGSRCKSSVYATTPLVLVREDGTSYKPMFCRI